MKPDLDLIEKFLKNQCTDAEAEFVHGYFKEHPGDIEQYIPLNDWLTDSEKRLGITVSERILQRTREMYNTKRQGVITKSLVRYAVAASVTGIMILGSVKLFTKTGRRLTEKSIAITSGTDNVQPLEMIENKSVHEMQSTLPDGSAVTVYPNSSLQYLPAFEKNRRDLYLKGKALFHVSKDASRPFTVYAAGIATTALGTKFLVSELADQNVSVALMEGSVKVWPQYAAEENKMVLLRPGDELVVSSGHFSSYSLKRSAEKDQKNAVAKTNKNRPVKEEPKFVFKNHSLEDVFKQLGEKFGVTINYEAAAGIEEKLFTGTFLKNDNLEFICKTVCSLHGLQYKIDGNRVTVSSQ